MNWRDRITADPDTLMGKPRIKGTRIGVVFLLDRIAEGWTSADILESYPHLTREDVAAALAFAEATSDEEQADDERASREADEVYQRYLDGEEGTVTQEEMERKFGTRAERAGWFDGYQPQEDEDAWEGMVETDRESDEWER